MHLSSVSAIIASCSLWKATWAVPADAFSSPSDMKRDTDTPPFSGRFNVKLDNSPGNCQWVGSDFLNNMLVNARTLAKKGQDMIEAFKAHDDAAERLVRYYFFKTGTTTVPPGAMDLVAERYAGLEKWIVSGGPTRNGQATKTPWYFCSDLYREPRKETDDLQGPDGDIEFNPTTGEPLPISSSAAIQKKLKEAKERFKAEHEDDPDEPLKKATVYWVKDLKDYLVDRDYSDSEYYRDCEMAAGVTDSSIDDVDFILMCPLAFRANNKNPNINKAQRLGEIPPDPVPYSKVNIKTSQPVTAYETPSSVLFHELFHLLYEEDSYPDDGEFYDLDDIIAADIENSKKNPETYSLAALAWYYTTKSQPVNKMRIEYYSGFATQG